MLPVCQIKSFFLENLSKDFQNIGELVSQSKQYFMQPWFKVCFSLILPLYILYVYICIYLYLSYIYKKKPIDIYIYVYLHIIYITYDMYVVI